MTVYLKDVPAVPELTVDEIEPISANVKYAQRNDADIQPILANVKYAQRNDADVLPIVANVKYAQRFEEVMELAEVD